MRAWQTCAAGQRPPCWALLHSLRLEVAACHLGGRCARADRRFCALQQQYATRRGPNSDDFIPVKGGSDFGGHSRGGSLGGGKDESVFDPEEALLAKVHS